MARARRNASPAALDNGAIALIAPEVDSAPPGLNTEWATWCAGWAFATLEFTAPRTEILNLRDWLNWSRQAMTRLELATIAMVSSSAIHEPLLSQLGDFRRAWENQIDSEAQVDHWGSVVDGLAAAYHVNNEVQEWPDTAAQLGLYSPDFVARVQLALATAVNQLEPGSQAIWRLARQLARGPMAPQIPGSWGELSRMRVGDPGSTATIPQSEATAVPENPPTGAPLSAWNSDRPRQSVTLRDCLNAVREALLVGLDFPTRITETWLAELRACWDEARLPADRLPVFNADDGAIAYCNEVQRVFRRLLLSRHWQDARLAVTLNPPVATLNGVDYVLRTTDHARFLNVLLQAKTNVKSREIKRLGCIRVKNIPRLCAELPDPIRALVDSGTRSNYRLNAIPA